MPAGKGVSRPRLSISSATSGDRAQSTVGALLATIDATVVPQEPPPSTATRGCLRSILQLTSLNSSRRRRTPRTARPGSPDVVSDALHGSEAAEASDGLVSAAPACRAADALGTSLEHKCLNG